MDDSEHGSVRKARQIMPGRKPGIPGKFSFQTKKLKIGSTSDQSFSYLNFKSFFSFPSLFVLSLQNRQLRILLKI